MSGQIVNLGRARKARGRAAAETVAARNRALHGRTPSERERQRLADEQAARRLDGHRRGEGDE